MSSIVKEIQKVRVSQKQVNRKIKDVLIEFENNEIIIPQYQRTFVWDISIQSRFIESIFMEIPVPPIFLLEKYDEENGEINYEVIDGVQRLSTLSAFMKDKLRLSSDLKLTDLSRQIFSKLPEEIKKIFLNREISTIIIERTTNPEIQFEIFERLNRGSVSLSHQELRNCMYHGNFNNFLISLSKFGTYANLLSPFPIFKKVESGKPDKNRMLDIEMILRFFTLYESYQNTGKFVSPRKEELNFYMKEKKKIDKNILENNDSKKDIENNKKLEDIFKKICEMVKLCFKDNHYRRFRVEKNQAKFINFNKAVFDIQMIGFLDYEINDIENKTDVIYHEFLELCCFNQNFIDSINKSTDDKINERIEIWKNHLKDIINNFSNYSQKIELKITNFEIESECFYCKKHVKHIDESYFDMKDKIFSHISCYIENDDKKLKKRTSLINFSFFGEEKNLESNDALFYVLKKIVEEIKDDSYQVDRLLSFDFIGNSKKLNEKYSILKTKRSMPIGIKSKGEDLYIFLSFSKNECLDNIEELVKVFGLKDEFKII